MYELISFIVFVSHIFTLKNIQEFTEFYQNKFQQ